MGQVHPFSPEVRDGSATTPMPMAWREVSRILRCERAARVLGCRCATVLLETLDQSPPDFGFRRPTRTQPLLIAVAARHTGVSRMSRLLKELRVRRGSPIPLAPCPGSEKARRRRVNMLHRLNDTLRPREVAVWEYKADIDLNPRIGPDWMLPGAQCTVMTPGKYVKRYAVAALDARTGRLTWVTGKKKDRVLFIDLRQALA